MLSSKALSRSSGDILIRNFNVEVILLFGTILPGYGWPRGGLSGTISLKSPWFQTTLFVPVSARMLGSIERTEPALLLSICLNAHLKVFIPGRFSLTVPSLLPSLAFRARTPSAPHSLFHHYHFMSVFQFYIYAGVVEYHNQHQYLFRLRSYDSCLFRYAASGSAIWLVRTNFR